MNAPAASPAPDDTPLDSLLEQADRTLHAMVGHLSGGLSPIGLGLAWADWALHLAAAPGRQMQLALKAQEEALSILAGPECPACARAAADKRFRAPEWRRLPFSMWAAGHKAAESWWQEATCAQAGVDAHHARITAFAARQILDMASPSNFLATNPEVLRRTVQERGANLWRGARHMAEDVALTLGGAGGGDLGGFEVGKTLAVTPGKVVLRNSLIELIQYAPATPEVHARPLLIVPAWIMKYYILDLTPQDSLIRWLVGQGFTVFCISWRNPGPDEGDLAFEDYLDNGLAAALSAVEAIVPDEKVHLAGYCLGGTLAAIGAARLARGREDRLASLTLLAAQTDFSEPGELGLFIGASQLALLDDMMWQQGGLLAGQMAGAFQLLKSNDLIWSRMQREYLLGERGEPNDLMAWNADATRMPWRMHSRYLRELYLENRLAQGRFEVEGKPVSLSDLRLPIFAVGTENDHVAPWRSVYKIAHLSPAPVTFALANGGHNGGIIAWPGHPKRSYRMHAAGANAPWVDAGDWYAAATPFEGSWWLAWADWLRGQNGRMVPARAPGGDGFAPLGDAPGDYVLN